MSTGEDADEVLIQQTVRPRLYEHHHAVPREEWSDGRLSAHLNVAHGWPLDRIAQMARYELLLTHAVGHRDQQEQQMLRGAVEQSVAEDMHLSAEELGQWPEGDVELLERRRHARPQPRWLAPAVGALSAVLAFALVWRWRRG